MRFIRIFGFLGVLLSVLGAQGQEGARWSKPRNILPSGMEAREAKLVILSDGSLNVTFRGSEISAPEVGGVFFTRSEDQGYSWSRPKPAVSVPGIQDVTHEIQSEGGNLLLYVTVFRPPRFEVLQFLSTDRGGTWRETDTVFVNTDPIRGIVTWRQEGRMFLAALTERTRSGDDSEYSFYLARGRASGAYWDTAIKIHNIFATSISPPSLIDNGPGQMPDIYFRRNAFQDMVLEVVTQDGLTWYDHPITAAPPTRGLLQQDGGVYYDVRATPQRQILFNRTDDVPPRARMITQIPASVSKPNLRVVWEGEDNYTLPGDIGFEVQLDEEPAELVRGATTYRFDALLNGNHRLTITAIDEAENRQSPPTTERFTVQVLPVPQFLTPRNGDLLNQTKTLASWEGTHNCGPESPLLFSLKVDDREWTEYTEETSMEIEGLEDGEHAFFLRAKDALDNISEDGVNVRFEVDNTPPTCVVEEVPRDWDQLDMPWPDLPDYKVEFRIVGNDNRTPGEDLEFRYRLDDQEASDWRPISELAVFTDLPDGLHRVSFETRDEALNVQAEPTTLNFEFNTPPNTRVWMDETISPPTYRFSGKDSNSEAADLSYRWRIDEGNWSDWTFDNEVIANSILGGVSHGQHRLFVQARDSSENFDPSPAEMLIDVDTVPPEPPTGLTLTARENGAIVEIRWDEVSESGARYNVYRSTQESFDREGAELIVPAMQRTRSSDRPSRGENTTQYYYFVTALDRAENESAPGPSQSVAVLGQKEIDINNFQELAGDVNDLIRLEQWNGVLDYSKNAPEPPPGFEGYPAYWSSVAQAEIALSQEPPSLQGLLSARTNLESFMARYPDFEHGAEVQERFDDVKSQILWNRLLAYGKYAAYLVVALILLAIVYKWIQRRRITEMPKITVTEGVEEITPSKEALKDPTVLRRWAEVQADPGSAENWSRLAFAFHNIGEVGTAIQSLYKAMEIEPNNTRFHFQMGHFQKETGNLRESIRHFDRYLQLNPESKKSAEEVRELLVKLKAELGA